MEHEKKTWFKEHVDTLAIIGLLLAGFYWADGKFDKVNERFTSLERDVTAIKTTLIIKNIMPNEIAKCEKKGE
jgi:hypothetical protein